LNIFFPDDEYEFMHLFNNSIRHKKNKERDKLMNLYNFIDFQSFKPLLSILDKTGSSGGRPRIDMVLMFKIIFLGVYYDLSYQGIENRIGSDDAVQCFLFYPKKLPKRSTIWNFKEQIVNFQLTKEIWEIFKMFSMEHYYSMNYAVRQDASFFTADPGHKRANYPRGNKARTRRNRDGTFVKKNNKTYFGYKIHTKQDVNTQLIVDFELTVSNIHDIKINLCEEEEIDYKDKGYFKKEYHQMNGAMTRSVRNHPLNIWEKKRNHRISSQRAPVELPYAKIHDINNSHTKLTTRKRNEVQVTIIIMIFNLQQLNTLKKQENEEKKIKAVKEETVEPLTEFSFEFFDNSNIYYENPSLINFLIHTSPIKKIRKVRNTTKKTKNKKNIESISKSDYKRRIKRQNQKTRKKIQQKNKKVEKKYNNILNSLNEFNLAQIEI
jgi:IS5 family transposase